MVLLIKELFCSSRTDSYSRANGFIMFIIFEPPHDKTNKMTVLPAKTDQSDQSLRCALSRLLRTQTFFMRTAKTDLSLRWAHVPFCRFCHEAAQLLCKTNKDQIL